MLAVQGLERIHLAALRLGIELHSGDSGSFSPVPLPRHRRRQGPSGARQKAGYSEPPSGFGARTTNAGRLSLSVPRCDIPMLHARPCGKNAAEWIRFRRPMSRIKCIHRLDDADIVDHRREVGQQLAYLDSGFPCFLKVNGDGIRTACLTLCSKIHRIRPLSSNFAGFGIEHVELMGRLSGRGR